MRFTKHVAVRQDLLQHSQEVPINNGMSVYHTKVRVPCVPWPSRVNCNKQSSNCLVYTGPHVRTAGSVHEMMVLAEINRKSSLKYYRLVHPGSILGSHWLVSIVNRWENIMENARTAITHVAELGIDRLAEFTADEQF